jgi:flavin reductase (DIM6/NTAB) family NADH-FMN oxidoreductase RutF
MEFDFALLSGPERYRLMAAAITPRPIAWITTLSSAGVRNAAPFSFFNMMGASPPLVALGLMLRQDRMFKDTAVNILETREFVINLVTENDGPQMNFTCIDAPPQFDEVEAAGLLMTPSSVVSPARIATAPVSMECRVFNQIQAGDTSVILGEVLRFHIADAFVDANSLHVDTLAMNLIARMHGRGWYTRSDNLLRFDRPRYADWVEAGRPPIGAWDGVAATQSE